MKKRIFALLLTLLMVVSLMPMAFAAQQPASDVKVPASIYVRKEGTDADWSSSTKTVTMSKADMAKTVDFRCELNTAPIKNAIIEWYDYGVSLISGLAGDDEDLKTHLTSHFTEWPVTGSFTVTITIPEKLHVPEEYTNGATSMIGFNAGASDLFTETDRELSADGKTLTISIAIKDGIMEQALYTGVVGGTYLDELTFTVEGVTMDTFTTAQTVTGKMEGSASMQIGTDHTDDKVVEFFTETVRATLKLPSTNGSAASDDYKITFNIDGKTDELDPIYDSGTVKVSDLPTPTKVGYKFDGWYFDSKMTEKVTENFKLTKGITLYGHWESNIVDTENHYAYVIGYPDGTVRAEQNITREEVAMIFYRLLRDDVRADLLTDKNDFTDVEADRWSNVAISTMVNGGFIVGYPDGTFGPERNITRAEFATMATRFASLMDDSGASFSDIEAHWSKYYVLKAATAGWIAGYPDGTFLPERNITRAEAFTIINRVLARSVNAEGLHADTTLWSDMTTDDWYYYIVLEATNSHTYTRQADGINETWTSIIPNKTWD